jgi:transmembrane sensor
MLDVDTEAARWFARMHGPGAETARAELEQWLAASPAHRSAYARAEQVWDATAGLARTSTGAARRLPEPRLSLWQLPAARPVFAALAMLLIVFAGVWVMRSPQPDAPLVAAASQSLVTPVGEIRQFKLADGSTVTLDTDSQVEVRMSSTVRSIQLLRGRARFDVAHDAARPFQVEAAGRTVTALGTIFDVGFESQGVRVTLFRGSVDVHGLPSAGLAAAVTRLAPGQCFFDPLARPQVALAAKGDGLWTSGMLEFDGVALGAVLEQTNRYSERKIALSDPSLASLRVTGAFRPLPTDQLAAALAAAFGLRAESSEKGVLLSRR